jgi:pimeloyl-ACP methyl ester carboxylesterase
MPSIEVNGIEVNYREAGAGPGVVLAHSSCSTSGQWRALIEQLSPRFHVLAPDLIGYGRTASWPQGRGNLYDDEAAILFAMAERAGGRAHLVGHSFGGVICAHALWRRPAIGLSLTLIEPPLYRFLEAVAGPEALAPALPVARFVIEHGADRPLEAAERFVCRWTGEEHWFAMDDERRLLMAHAIVKTAQELRNEFRFPQVGPVEFAAMRLPALVMAFGDSPEPLPQIARLLAAALPDAECVELPGLGHMAPALQPERVNPTIVRFLDRMAAERGSGLAQA